LATLMIATSLAVSPPPSVGLSAAAIAPNLAAGQPIGFGNAGNYGSVAGQTLAAPVVGMASTPSGNGYWLVASDGGIFAFGDAQFWGATGGQRLNKPVVWMAATPSGLGYRLVASDGGIFAFGDAQFYGSTGGIVLNQPVVGMASTPSGHGYWLVASDGGIFAFGDAPFSGSMAGDRLQAPVIGMSATPSGRGYWLGAADGGVFNFGDAPFLGSVGDGPLADPIVAIAGLPGGGGFWLLPGPPLPVGGPTVAGLAISNLSNLPGGLYPPGDKVAALTFDDGPNPTYTPQILQVLTQYHVPATFQIVGYEGAARPDLLKLEVADGMTLTNHTWDHASLISLNPGQFAGEVDATTNLIQSVTGQTVKCVRPPYGYSNASVLTQLAQRGLGELLWDIDPSDYTTPGTGVITNRVLGALHPGAIVIMHDGGGDRSQTVAALPAIITGIEAAGYRLEPVCN
jgi:peptidoglycan/xylan/chitin deacetylase (PgdA/CDA1 family)